MKIENVKVNGLNGKDTFLEITFNEDINIITGRNGSGKTTILKLMWFCISGNIERAVEEIAFEKIEVKTTAYTLVVERQESKNKDYIYVLLTLPNGEQIFEKKEPAHRSEAVERANQETIELLDTSIFFPTFRRIEGGFSMGVSRRNRPRRVVRGREEFLIHDSLLRSEIQDALESHAEMLSVGNHKFVSSISTFDIQQLVSRQHSSATNKVENFSKSLTENIFEEIRSYKASDNSSDALRDAVSTLDKIDQDVKSFENVRNEAFKSLTVLSSIIVKIFEHKGIRLNPRVTLGDMENSINSEALSAGEKQMLSFLCYNALYRDCPFFIDEPELSLHVDWQRILLDVMLEQKTNNQLFIATHSPFIYTQFEDKEIMISADRGCTNV